MNRPVLILCISALAACILAVPILYEAADAKSTKKIHFTKTLSSVQDPGQGQQGHIAMLIPPGQGLLHEGHVTYVASKPVRLVVLHEMTRHDAGHPTWTIDNRTVYGQSMIGDAASGSHGFVGGALMLQGTEPFTATASVDGWIRTGTIDPAPAPITPASPGIEIFRPQVHVEMPYRYGMFNGSQILYIITDSSSAALAAQISSMQNWTIQYTEIEAPEGIGRIYLFDNGIYGDGLHGFQDEVFSTAPDHNYTSLAHVHTVSWRPGQNAQTLHSVPDIMEAHESGRIKINDTGIILNAPHIAWPQGQIEAGDGTQGQLFAINHTAGTVTFVAHRGWGPAGTTTYCIITDASPAESARLLGVPHSPATAALSPSPAVSRSYQFSNGLAGPGHLGFQPGIAASAPGQEGYTPITRAYVVQWIENATLLQTIHDIETAERDGLVTITAARPLNQNYVINCPAIDESDLKG